VRQRLRNYAWKMVHDTGAADAIAEDAVLRALERLEVDRPRFFLPWLFQISRNLALHWIRDKKSTERMLEKQGYRDNRSAFADTLSREALKIFDGEIQRLTERQRQVLLMRVIDHLSYEEIGEKLGLSRGAARALGHRARANLASWLGYMRAL
jgi:RNA polymerase sigma factor (sigma-70 family)